MKQLVLSAAVAIALALPRQAEATHLRSADIKVEPICESPRTFRITVVAYLDTHSGTPFGSNSQLFFGDGSFVTIPRTVATPRPDLGDHVAVAVYVTTHTYAQAGVYRITCIERDRNGGIVNIENPAEVPYVTNITIDISSKFGCNNFPVLSVPPLDRACHKSAFYHTSGAYDADGDSLSYEFTIPLGSETNNAPYISPTHTRFYLNPAKGNEEESGPASLSIDTLSGLVTWDAPGLVGQYNIAFHVIEWRKDNATGIYDKISTTTRDMQIEVEECDNRRPELIIPVDTCVVAGSIVDIDATGLDDDEHPVRIEVFSEIVDFPDDKGPATYSPHPPTFQPSSPFASLNLKWATQCSHVRQQPYQVVFKITDNPPEGPRLVSFRIWNVKVIGPPPELSSADLDLVKRAAALNWDSYECENAKSLQVWRKVGSHPGASAYCDVRSPALWGYKLIKELDVGETNFTDDNFGAGLAAGAMYCYRVIGVFNDTRSYASEEVCVGPIGADAPVITHVSVEKTALEGSVSVSWRSPFDINSTQFPPPYEYEIYRGTGYVAGNEIAKAGRVSDTTFLDSGVNTEDSVFNYRIVLFGKPQSADQVVAIDTSATSSSVWLTAHPRENEIELVWRDSAAWSNVIATDPWHLIYRSVDDQKTESMVLIDSVDVTVDGFKYADRGKYLNEPIAEDKYYSYRVLTRGTYGNPRISRLDNYSQVASSYPANDLQLCAPVITVDVNNCEQYLATDNCNTTVFTNHLSWSVDSLVDCRHNIRSYKIYASSDREGTYELIASNVLSTSFTDTELSSYKRCYRVAAVDKEGNEGPMGDPVCNDNCPSYQLPNVFSPNDDGYNDSFHARFDPNSAVTAVMCPRFIVSVDLSIIDRWGKEIYRRRSETPETAVNLEWDGRDDNGVIVPAGVYYYAANVVFDVLDMDGRERMYRGWVQLVR